MGTKKKKRLVLGVGHPWFSTVPQGPSFSLIGLTTDPVSSSILCRTFTWAEINTNGLGNWNKIRLIAEVIK